MSAVFWHYKEKRSLDLATLMSFGNSTFVGDRNGPTEFILHDPACLHLSVDSLRTLPSRVNSTSLLDSDMSRHSLIRLIFQRCLWTTACLAALLGSAAAWAQDHILERAYWTDVSGQASFEQAREASYTPYSGVLSKGYNSHAQWIRLRIGGVPSGGPDTLVLRIRPVYLDAITLFDPVDLSHGQGVRTTGDLTTWRSTEFESLHHTFVIAAQPAPRYVWLRLSTVSTQLLHVEALSPREMLREEHVLWLAYSALLALILSFLVWVLMAWLRDHDSVNGAFVLRQTVLLLYTASYLGYHRLLLVDVLEPHIQDAMYSGLVLLTTALSFAFEYRLLSEYLMPRWGHTLMRSLLLISAVAMLLLLTGHTPIALHLNMFINGAGLCILVLISLFIQTVAPNRDHPFTYQLPKGVLIGYYLTIVLFLALSILPSLGLMQGNMLSIYGVLLYGLISGLFMSTLLIVRSRQMERIRQDVANSLFLSRQQLTVEQQRRQDQTQLLSMLMHELKTPLSVIDMAVSTRGQDGRMTDYVNRAVDNIKGILDRCIQTDRMVEREFRLQAQHVHLSDQVQLWLHDRKEGVERFDAHIEPGLVLSSDLQCIQIIANNLIENALHHGDAQSPVQVGLATQANEKGQAGMLLWVSNQPGPSGRPEPDKIFGKYYRGNAAQRQSGTGLGLYLSHNLALRLGGTLSYRPGAKHIRFELWLPT